VVQLVARARASAAARWSVEGRMANAEVPGFRLRQPPWRLPTSVTRPLEESLNTGLLSARGHDRVLRVAWTIADLDGRDRPDAGDIGEALALRTGRPA
jgi:magnesium chelatase family protein